MTPTRPILRYFGGKWLLAPWIIDHLPAHRVYVEPFGGAASVLLRKPRSYAEVYNDLDSSVVGLFRALRDPALAAELERRVRLTPFAREEFELAYQASDDPLERARRLVVRSFMGFGSDGHNAAAGMTGFRANSNKSGTTPAHDWVTWPDEIAAFCRRLAGVVVENRDAREVMAQHDAPATLHFVDPPYLHETRDPKHGYAHEMTADDHEALLDFLSGLMGMVVLCGYPSPRYDRLGWLRVDRKAFADGARARTECLWLNASAARAQPQRRLL
jgi:DNA adenine methylase